MPIETKTRPPESQSLGQGSGEQHISNVAHTQASDPVSGVKRSFLHVKRLFSGAGLSCLNLDMRVPDLDGAVAYLTEFPHLSGVIERSYEELQRLFEAPIRLEVYPDPEGERDLELALIVETSEKPAVALEKLSEFDERFWIDRIDEVADHLSVHIEYQ